LAILYIALLLTTQALLEVVHDLFEQQTSVESVVGKIMQRAQTLLNCERCVVVLDKQHPTLSSAPSVITGSDVTSPSPVLYVFCMLVLFAVVFCRSGLLLLKVRKFYCQTTIFTDV